MSRNELAYHEAAVIECREKGYSSIHNQAMVELYREKAAFYAKFPTRQGRRMARKEGVKAGRWY